VGIRKLSQKFTPKMTTNGTKRPSLGLVHTSADEEGSFNVFQSFIRNVAAGYVAKMSRTEKLTLVAGRGVDALGTVNMAFQFFSK